MIKIVEKCVKFSEITVCEIALDVVVRLYTQNDELNFIIARERQQRKRKFELQFWSWKDLMFRNQSRERQRGTVTGLDLAS
jgi:hypothetical protein